ncbi:hypothetical protein [Nonomuraea sediminis]|uniref:hypothetical protein n=1 Tax=Nonomuraea sediminis TaxID=2835864 RepID=UPI001BDD36BE|nr:hypothetical protein [Nonomuraea sediminis]
MSFKEVAMTGSELARQLLSEEPITSPIVSLYFTVPADPDQLVGLVRQACPDLDHATLDGVRGALEDLPGTRGGVALFVSRAPGLRRRLPLPGYLAESAHVGMRPYVRPLLAALHRSVPYCVAVFDEARAWIGVRREDRLVESAVVTGEETHAGHLRRIADLLEDAVGKDGVEAVVLGGRADDVTRLIALLPTLARRAFSGHMVVEPSAVNPVKLRRLADEVVARWRASADEKLAAAVLDEAAAGTYSVEGLPSCLAAVNSRSVHQLLVEEGPDVPGAACEGCAALLPDVWPGCPTCGGRVHPVPDVLEEAVVAVLRGGGEVVPLPPYLLEGVHAAARLRRG